MQELFDLTKIYFNLNEIISVANLKQLKKFKSIQNYGPKFNWLRANYDKHAGNFTKRPLCQWDFFAN